MITIYNKTECCGCSACELSCPQSCITLQRDSYGFNYPVVNETNCINCHLCEKVCPVINQYKPKNAPLNCYLSKTSDEEIRAMSSSGGIFTEISRYVISQDGVVFGVRFNDQWLAEYGYTETFEGLDAFRGSKYIQADVRGVFRKVQEFLNIGRLVLFSGTPCYVAGLNHFLKKTYDNLITLDIVCHSIPSPKIWSLYLDELKKKRNANITDVTFRDKSKGWSEYSLSITFCNSAGKKSKLVESHFKNIFSKGFAEDIFTRPSCSNCPARNYKSNSDITVADAWAINKYRPDQNDEKGISHVLLNTEKGLHLFKLIQTNVEYTQIDYIEVEPTKIHSPLTISCKANPYREWFYDRIQKGDTVSNATNKTLFIYKINKLYHRIFNKIKRIIR